MNRELMQQALELLDKKLSAKKYKEVKLLIGGGGAFALAYGVPLHTADIDAVLFKSKINMAELDPLIKETGRLLKISPDWLNPHFGTFMFCLPENYAERLKKVFSGDSLEVHALGPSDLLIMKCFAGREKDMPHAKVLIRKGADIDLTQNHIEKLIAKNIPGAKAALDFLFEAEEQVGG